MKLTKQILATIAMLLCSLTVSADPVEINAIWYNLESGDMTAEVTTPTPSGTASSHYSGDIIIPSVVNYNEVEYTVTKIGENAFAHDGITSIVLPESVCSIEKYAFWNCDLISIDIPKSVTSIGEGAFGACYGLTSIIIPKSVTSIGNSAFEGCPKLTSIVVEDGNEKYDSRDGCNAIIQTRINSLIAGCSTTIIPESVTSIGIYAFRDCSSLTSIKIPNSVKKIGSCAFYYCENLTDVSINEDSQLIEIGNQAFDYCKSLTTFTIPAGVTSIGNKAFPNLTAVNIGSIEAWCKIPFENWESNPLYYADLYLNGSLVTELVIPESVTSIGNYAFISCRSLTSITIPDGVTSIGKMAFDGCGNLTSVVIPGSVTDIGKYAFCWCDKLYSVTLSEGLWSIGENAFTQCHSLTTITIPEGTRYINEEAFSNCVNLQSIVLPKSLNGIDSKAFEDCTELQDVYMYAESVPYTASDAFNGCYPEYATLHVPTSALANYKNTVPWSSFGEFETTDIAILDIELSQSSVTLTEGENTYITITITPDDAEDKSVSWSSSNPYVATVDDTGKVTAIAAGTATITVTANDGSGVSASCEVEVKEKLLGKCATPVVNYVDGKVMLTCETEGVTFKSSITADDARSYDEAIYALTGIYTITAYATKAKYETSDVVTLTLCWVPCDKNHDSEETGIINIPSRPVLIQTDGGTITVNGLAEGTVVKVNDLNGVELGTATATGGTATITTNLTAGSVAIVKIGERSVKVAIK